MSIEGCLRGPFMRLILLFASVILMLISVLLFVKSFQEKYSYNTIEVSSADYCFIVILALAIYLVALSFLSIHATFFRYSNSIEWFSLLAGLNVFLSLAVFLYASPRLKDSSIEIDLKLKDLQSKYDWIASNTDNKTDTSNQIDSTRRWDIVQRMYQCCGVQSPADWLQYRPEDYVGEFPASCCHTLDEEKLCFKKNSWPAGCASQIKAWNEQLLHLLTSMILINLLLSIVGSLVICCHKDIWCSDVDD